MPLQEQNKKQLTYCNVNGSPAMRRAPVIFCGGKRMKKELIFIDEEPLTPEEPETIHAPFFAVSALFLLVI